MGDKSSWDSCLNRVLIAAYHSFYFKSGLYWEPTPPPPFQCCTGKSQILETGNPTLRRGEGVILQRWGKKFALSTPILQSVSTLLSPIGIHVVFICGEITYSLQVCKSLTAVSTKVVYATMLIGIMGRKSLTMIDRGSRCLPTRKDKV